LLGLSATACLELTYTDDGVPIVPYAGADSPGTWRHRVGGAGLVIEVEAWTNRMPGSAAASGPGFPLGVMVRITPDSSNRDPDSLLVPALSLWSPGGDSLRAALRLVRLDGGDPWVNIGRGAAPTELTAARSAVRRLAGPPDMPCAPRLLVKSMGQSLVLALPETPVTAAY
jgi:hypothetical protein